VIPVYIGDGQCASGAAQQRGLEAFQVQQRIRRAQK